MFYPRQPKDASEGRDDTCESAPGEGDRAARRGVERALARQVRRFAATALDPLTGLVNRAGLLVLGEAMLRLARAANEGVAVLRFSVEAPGAGGDRSERAAADHALPDLARAIESNLRTSDLLARVGDAEFCVVVAPYADHAQAERLISRLRVAVAEHGGAEAGCWALGPNTAGARDHSGLRFEALVALAEAKLREARDATQRSSQLPPVD